MLSISMKKKSGPAHLAPLRSFWTFTHRIIKGVSPISSFRVEDPRTQDRYGWWILGSILESEPETQ